MADIQSNIKVNIDTSNALEQIKLLQSQISAFHTQMGKSGAAAAAQSAQLRQSLVNGINATGKFSAQMTTVKTSTEYFTQALEKNKLTMGEYFKYAGGASKTFGKLFKSEFETINKVARERVKDLQTQYIKMGRDANGAMQAIKVRPLALDMENLGTKTAIAAQRQQLLNQLLKQGSTNLLNFGKNTQWAGRQLMVGFTVPLMMMASIAIKSFKEMEEATVKFKRVYGDLGTTNEETNKMAANIKSLAESFTQYGVAVKDTMDMAATAAATGKMGTDLIAQVSSATKLSVLGGVDQQKALQTTISLTNAFGLSADDLAKKINFLNAVENQTVLSIDDLTTAIPKAAPIVKQLGGSVEDLAFFLTAMKEGGISAAEGANALKSGLASMINPTGTATKMLSGFGINIKGIVNADKGNLKKTVVDFASALDKLDPLNRARAIEQMFGKFQFARISTLFKNVVDQNSQAGKALELTKATNEELAILSERELKKVSDSPLYKYQKAMKDFQNAMVPIGEQFLKALSPILNFVNGILKQFNGLGDGTKTFIVGLTTIVAGIGPVVLMVVGLVANGIANLIKLFANFKSFFNGLGKSSKDLGSSTKYMTSEQIEAASVAASLDQVHGKLTQTFTSEAEAIQLLVTEYQKATRAQVAFSETAMLGGMKPTRGYATGGIIRGPGTGTSDSIVARLSNGEAVIPAQSVSQHPELVKSLISGNIPAYATGFMPKYGSGGFVMPPRMWQREIGPQTQAAALASEKKALALQAMHEEVLSSPYSTMPVMKLPQQLVPSAGNSFITPRIGGIYQLASGEQVFIKPQPNLASALAELRGTKIAREVHGLIAPEQTLRVILDPTDPNGKRTLFALESKLNEKIANPGSSFTRKEYFKQLTASLLRGDKDLGPGNLGGNVLADVGPSGVFARATRNTEMTTAIPSMEEQAMINLLGVKGGAKKWFAQATSGIAKTMTPIEYHNEMLAEINSVLPKLKATVANMSLTNAERPYYEAMVARLEAGRGVDWSKFQQIHAAVPGFAKGMISGPGTETSDSILARVSNGEAIIPAKSVAKNPQLVRQLISGNIPAFNGGGEVLPTVSNLTKDYTQSGSMWTNASHVSGFTPSQLGQTIEELVAVNEEFANTRIELTNVIPVLDEFGKQVQIDGKAAMTSTQEMTTFGEAVAQGKLKGKHGIISGQAYGGTTVLESATRNRSVYQALGIEAAPFTLQEVKAAGELAAEGLIKISGKSDEFYAQLQILVNEGKVAATALESEAAVIADYNYSTEVASRAITKAVLADKSISLKERNGIAEAKAAEVLAASEQHFASLLAQGIPEQEALILAQNELRAQMVINGRMLSDSAIKLIVFEEGQARDLGRKIGQFGTNAIKSGASVKYVGEPIVANRGGNASNITALKVTAGVESGLTRLQAETDAVLINMEQKIASLVERFRQAGFANAEAYLKATNAVLSGPQNDMAMIARDRNSPHRTAGPDGAEDGIAYNTAKTETLLELGATEQEILIAQNESFIALSSEGGAAEGAAHAEARIAAARAENAELLAIREQGAAEELAASEGFVGRRAARLAEREAAGQKNRLSGLFARQPKYADDFVPTTRAERKAFDKQQAKANVKAGGGGKGMGAMMALSMLPMMATAIPGSVGKAAQDNMMPLMALSMLPMILPMLTTPLGLLVTVIASVAAAFLMLRNNFDETQKKIIENGNAFKASTEAIQKYAVFNNKVTASELRDRERATSLSPYGVKPGKTTFGESFIQTEAGKDLSNKLATLTAAGDKLQAERDLSSQLATAVLSGAMDMKQAKSIAVNVAKAAGDITIGTQAIAKLEKVLGAQGEKAVSNPIGVRMQLMKQQEKEQKMALNSMNSNINSADRFNATSDQQLAGVSTGVAGGGLAGAGIGGAIGSAFFGVGAAPGAIIGGVIGAIAGGVTAYISMRPSVEKIAKFTAATSIDAKILLETNKQLLDSYDLQYEKKHQELIDQGKIAEADKLQNDYLTKRNKLTKEISKAQTDLVIQYNEQGNLQQALMDGAKKATDAKYKDNANELAYLDVARQMSNDLVSNKTITGGQQYLIELKMAAGDLPPSQARTLLDFMTNNADMAPKVMKIVTKLAGQESSQTAQILAMINDPNVKKDFITRVSVQPNDENAKRLLDVFSNIEQANGVFNVDLEIGYYSRNATAKNSVLKDFEDINKKVPKTQSDLQKIVNQTKYEAATGDNSSAYSGYISKLGKNQRNTYTKVVSQIMNVDIATTVTSDDFKRWQTEDYTDADGVRRGGAQWASTSTAQQLSRYADDMASKTVQTGMDLSSATTPVTDTSGTQPQASFLDQIVKGYRDAFGWQQKLTVGFTKSKIAIDGFVVRGFNGLAVQLAKAGVGPAAIQQILDAPQSEIDKIVDKNTGKIKTSFLKTLPSLAELDPFSKSNIVTRWLTMTKDQQDQERISMYQAGLDVIKVKEDGINKKYDARIKALDSIKTLNDEINQSQQDEIDLADALTQGDMARAAKAMQQMQADKAKSAIEATRQSLQDARQAELDGSTAKINGKVMTRAEAEAEIEKLTTRINAHKLIQLNREIAIGDELDRQVIAYRELSGKDSKGNPIGTKYTSKGVISPNGTYNDVGKLITPTTTTTVVDKKPKKTDTSLLTQKQIDDMKANDPTSVIELKKTHSLQWSYIEQKITPLITKIQGLGTQMAAIAKQHPFVTSVKASEKDLGNRRLNANEQRALYEYRQFSQAKSGWESDVTRLRRDQNALGETGPGYYATGGHIKGAGTGTSDSIPAMLSNGEYVIRANAVKKIGVNTLDKLNQADRMKFANGGLAIPRFANGGYPKFADGGYNGPRPAPQWDEKGRWVVSHGESYWSTAENTLPGGMDIGPWWSRILKSNIDPTTGKERRLYRNSRIWIPGSQEPFPPKSGIPRIFPKKKKPLYVGGGEPISLHESHLYGGNGGGSLVGNMTKLFANGGMVGCPCGTPGCPGCSKGYAMGGMVGYKDGGKTNDTAMSNRWMAMGKFFANKKSNLSVNPITAKPVTQEELLSMKATDPKAPWNKGGWAQNSNDPEQRKAYWHQYGYKPSFFKAGDPSSNDVMDVAKQMSYFLPGIGAASLYGDAATAAQSGDYIGAGVDAAFATGSFWMPAVGQWIAKSPVGQGIKAGLRSGAKWIGDGVTKVASGVGSAINKVAGVFQGKGPRIPKAVIKEQKVAAKDWKTQVMDAAYSLLKDGKIYGNQVQDFRELANIGAKTIKNSLGAEKINLPKEFAGKFTSYKDLTPQEILSLVHELPMQAGKLVPDLLHPFGSPMNAKKNLSNIIFSDRPYIKQTNPILDFLWRNGILKTPKGLENLFSSQKALKDTDHFLPQIGLLPQILYGNNSKRSSFVTNTFTRTPTDVMGSIGNKLTDILGKFIPGFKTSMVQGPLSTYLGSENAKTMDSIVSLFPHELGHIFDKVRVGTSKKPIGNFLRNSLFGKGYRRPGQLSAQNATLEASATITEAQLEKSLGGEGLVRPYTNTSSLESLMHNLANDKIRPYQTTTEWFTSYLNTIWKARKTTGLPIHTDEQMLAMQQISRFLKKYAPTEQFLKAPDNLARTDLILTNVNKEIMRLRKIKPNQLTEQEAKRLPSLENIRQLVLNARANIKPGVGAGPRAGLGSSLSGPLQSTLPKIVNPSGVSRYLGTVKNISDNTMGGIKKYLGMTPNQEKYMWRQWEVNPDNANLYFNKFKSRARIPVATGPGRGIGEINYDAVEQLAKESGIVLKPGTLNVYGKLIEKLGLQYRPSDNQFLKDLVHTILPNAQGQSKLEIQRLNQLRKLVKPYEKDLSKMPGGIRAALEDMFAIHRSWNKKQKAVPASRVENQSNMFGIGPLEGPGLYTAGTLKISDQSWADYAGQYLYRQLYSPEAWKQVLKSKGYATDEIIAKTIQSNPKLLKDYNYRIDKTYGYTSVNLEGLKVSDKLIKHLMNEGYIGYRGGPTVKTNWRIGEPGFGLEPFNPNPNGILGYANGGMVAKYAAGGLAIPRFAAGGYAMGTDTIPAMLTPGEFVIKKSAVDRIGVANLNSANQNGTLPPAQLSESVYNTYSVNINVSSNSNPNDIANTVIREIRRIDNKKIRSNRV